MRLNLIFLKKNEIKGSTTENEGEKSSAKDKMEFLTGDEKEGSSIGDEMEEFLTEYEMPIEMPPGCRC